MRAKPGRESKPVKGTRPIKVADSARVNPSPCSTLDVYRRTKALPAQKQKYISFSGKSWRLMTKNCFGGDREEDGGGEDECASPDLSGVVVSEKPSGGRGGGGGLDSSSFAIAASNWCGPWRGGLTGLN